MFEGFFSKSCLVFGLCHMHLQSRLRYLMYISNDLMGQCLEPGICGITPDTNSLLFLMIFHQFIFILCHIYIFSVAVNIKSDTKCNNLKLISVFTASFYEKILFQTGPCKFCGDPSGSRSLDVSSAFRSKSNWNMLFVFWSSVPENCMNVTLILENIYVQLK